MLTKIKIEVIVDGASGDYVEVEADLQYFYQPWERPTEDYPGAELEFDPELITIDLSENPELREVIAKRILAEIPEKAKSLAARLGYGRRSRD